MREQSATSMTLRRRIILRQRVARQPCCRGARCFCEVGAVVSATGKRVGGGPCGAPQVGFYR